MHSRDSIAPRAPSPAVSPIHPVWGRSGGSRTMMPTQTYRIEEYRRTIYVNSPALPTTRDVDTILKGVSEMPEEDTTSSPHTRRSKSLTEREISVIENSSNNPVDRSTRHGSRGSLFVRSITSFETPPNTPATPHSRGPARNRVLFYHKRDPHYGFTNFSPHPVVYQGKRYPTSEHLFQSFKFQGHRPDLAEHIRTCSDWPSVAFREARRFQPEVRSDWRQVNIAKMDETLWHKFSQHQVLRDELFATGDAELVEDSDKDSFWGIGADHQGRNELGKALERLRDKFRE